MAVSEKREDAWNLAPIGYMQCNGKMIDQDIEEKSKVRVPEKECCACPTEVPNETSA